MVLYLLGLIVVDNITVSNQKIKEEKVYV